MVKQRIEFNYSKLKGKIKEKYNSQGAFADSLGCSRAIFSKKLNNHVEFTQYEMDKICSMLEVSKVEIPVYFFTQVMKH